MEVLPFTGWIVSSNIEIGIATQLYQYLKIHVYIYIYNTTYQSTQSRWIAKKSNAKTMSAWWEHDSLPLAERTRPRNDHERQHLILNSSLVILENGETRHSIPGNMKRQTCLKKNSFTASPRATWLCLHGRKGGTFLHPIKPTQTCTSMHSRSA